MVLTHAQISSWLKETVERGCLASWNPVRARVGSAAQGNRQWHPEIFNMFLQCAYPLVNIQKAMENGHRNSGFSHWKWWIFPWQNVSSPEGNNMRHNCTSTTPSRWIDAACIRLMHVGQLGSTTGPDSRCEWMIHVGRFSKICGFPVHNLLSSGLTTIYLKEIPSIL